MRLAIYFFTAVSYISLPLLAQGAVDGTETELDCRPAPDPSRIVVAGGSITEILFMLGEDNKIVAVDRTSNYPAEVSRFPVVGYVRALSAEGVLSLGPSLVLGEDDMGPHEVVSQLKLTGIEIRRVPEEHSAVGIVEKIICVATILGYTDDKIAKIRQDFDDSVEQIAALNDEEATAPKPRVAIIMALRDGVPFAAGNDTSADGVIEMAGAENVFASFDGWKPVSLEVMISSDPSFIVMPERGMAMSGGRDSVLSHPSVRTTIAGQKGRVIAVDGMTLLGFGPRTLQAALDLQKEFDIP